MKEVYRALKENSSSRPSSQEKNRHLKWFKAELSRFKMVCARVPQDSSDDEDSESESKVADDRKNVTPKSPTADELKEQMTKLADEGNFAEASRIKEKLTAKIDSQVGKDVASLKHYMAECAAKEDFAGAHNYKMKILEIEKQEHLKKKQEELEKREKAAAEQQKRREEEAEEAFKKLERENPRAAERARKRHQQQIERKKNGGVHIEELVRTNSQHKLFLLYAGSVVLVLCYFASIKIQQFHQYCIRE